MANVLFLGDVHAGHRTIVKYRDCFNTEEEHFQTIKENYHKVVTKRDKVFFMGDAAFTKEHLSDIKTWVGNKTLIVGNHDLERGITMTDLVDVYDQVYSFLKWHEFWLSHCPIHPNELRGKYNIHGHVHNKTVQDHRYFNTSMENINYTPVSLFEIRTELKKREDHINQYGYCYEL